MIVYASGAIDAVRPAYCQFRVEEENHGDKRTRFWIVEEDTLEYSFFGLSACAGNVVAQ